MRACGGLHRQYLAGHLLTYMAFKSRVQAFAVKLVGEALIADKGQSVAFLGRRMSPTLCPLNTTT